MWKKDPPSGKNLAAQLLETLVFVVFLGVLLAIEQSI